MTCVSIGCARSSATRDGGRRGYCGGHYERLKDGRPIDGPIRSWGANGPGYVTKGGYREVIARGRPNAGKDWRILEHRLVMSNVLGRPLFGTESVHHKNGDRLDNRPENLELWTRTQPAGHRVSDAVAYAVGVLETYSPELLR